MIASNNHQRNWSSFQPKRGAALVRDPIRSGCSLYRYAVTLISRNQTTEMCQVIVAIVSDRIRLRGVMMLITLPFAIAGYAAIANITAPRIRYGMTFLMATGMYSSVPCILVWNSNNSAGSYKRATTSAVQLAIANCSGFVASMYTEFSEIAT